MRCSCSSLTRFSEAAFIHTTVNLWPQQEIIHLSLKALNGQTVAATIWLLMVNPREKCCSVCGKLKPT